MEKPNSSLRMLPRHLSDDNVGRLTVTGCSFCSFTRSMLIPCTSEPLCRAEIQGIASSRPARNMSVKCTERGIDWILLHSTLCIPTCTRTEYSSGYRTPSSPWPIKQMIVSGHPLAVTRFLSALSRRVTLQESNQKKKRKKKERRKRLRPCRFIATPGI